MRATRTLCTLITLNQKKGKGERRGVDSFLNPEGLWPPRLPLATPLGGVN